MTVGAVPATADVRALPDRSDGSTADAASASTGRHRRDLLTVLTTYVATRVAVLVAFALAAAVPGAKGLAAQLGGYDGYWYRRIAEHGYPSTVPLDAAGHAQQNALAFFPLQPAVLRGVHALGPPYVAAAQVVDLLAGGAAAVLVLLVLLRCVPAEVARATVLLWCFWPAAYVLSMSYSEPLFTALAAGCLLALLRQRWAAAGVLALLASATRPTGLVLALVCLVGAIAATRRAGRWRPWTSVALAPWGAVAYLAYVVVHTGSLSAYTRTQREGWRTSLDGGANTVRQSLRALLHPGARPQDLAVVAFLAVVAVLAVLLVRDRPPAVLLAYTLGLLALAVTGGSGTYSSIPRLLLPAFPLLLPLATRLLARAPALVAAVATALAVLLGASAVTVGISTVITP